MKLINLFNVTFGFPGDSGMEIPLFFKLFFGFVISFIVIIFVITIWTVLKENRYNRSQPRLTVDASVIEKRVNVSGSRRNTGNSTTYSSTSTTYYVTFEFESGDRLELRVPHNQVGYIIEGDKGKLSFQGRKFISFDRG